MEKRATSSPNPFLPGSQQQPTSMTPRTIVASGEHPCIKISLTIDSISNASVDVIVNSTNKQLQLQRGAISTFILKDAGPQIQNECSQKYPRGISSSEIAITKGYNLKCKNVFHLALRFWNEDSPDSILANLTQIITNCLETAERMGAKSLAFPILGTGKMRYPIEKLPGIMYEAVKNYSNVNPSQIKDVYFVVFPTETKIIKIFAEYLNRQENEGFHSKETKLSSPFFPGPPQKTSPMTSTINVISTKNVGGVRINLTIGSISNASVDVIVNSTNKQLQLQRGAISTFILKDAGPQIQNECSQKYPRGISSSEIAITKGYNLKCKNVFHLALRFWNEDSPDSILANLTQIITTCLETAERMGAKSLAFPILGGGKLRYPIEELPGTMFEAVKNYSDQNSSQIKVVNFVVYPQDTYIVKKFKEYFQEISTDGSASSSAATKSQPRKSQKKKSRHQKVNTELIPDTWSPMGDEELMKIVPVTNGPEYDDIQATFRRNSPSSRIISIERIQNKTLYLGYQALKKKFEVENPNIRNEVDGLWHGTAEGSVNGINKSGFNRSYCGKNATVYGEGVYFAEDIRYSASDTYSTPDHYRIKRIYKCSVLVGKVMQGQHGLKVLQDSYNSAVDNIQKPSIYVIFHDSQAYPNYLITFSNY